MAVLPEKQENRISLFSDDDYIRIDKWYSDIKEFTFETFIIDFSVDEAIELKKANENWVHLNRLYKWKETDPKQDFGNLISTLEASLESPILINVRDRLDRAICACGSSGAFVKLSSRSPKDSAFTTPQMREIIEKSLNRSQFDLASWIACAVAAFVRASSQALRVRSGAEALKLLIRSRRIYEDITNIQLFHGEKKFRMDLVVRKWEDALDPTWEFRAFVVRGKMNAITQYYMLCYIPEIARNSEKLAKMMIEFWESNIKDRIKSEVDTYTIDFAITPEMDRIWVIELNHAPPTAGTALFDWSNVRDREIVSNGPFEMRVLTELPKNPLKELDAQLRKWMAELAPEQLRETIRAMVREGESSDGNSNINSNAVAMTESSRQPAATTATSDTMAPAPSEGSSCNTM